MLFLDKEYLGKKFKEYRKKAKLTQEELSEKIDISEKHYGQLERGSFSPSLETFFKIVETLNIPLSEFGIKNKEGDNKNQNRDELIKEIYSSNDNEIELFLEFVKSIKIYNKRSRF